MVGRACLTVGRLRLSFDRIRTAHSEGIPRRVEGLTTGRAANPSIKTQDAQRKSKHRPERPRRNVAVFEGLPQERKTQEKPIII